MKKMKSATTLAGLSPEDARMLKGLVTAVLCMQVITPFLQSGTAVILPAMGEHFHASATQLGLVSTVYCMALAIFNLAMGRAGDKWGRRRVCLFSMVILAPTTALVAFMPSIEAVIGLRFFQGMGTAAFATSSLAMLMACAPRQARGRLLGTTSTAVYVGLSVSPVVAGLVNTLFGWETFFFGIALWSAGCFGIMAVLVRREWHESADKPYDWGGLFLYTVGMVLAVQGFVGPMDDAWRPACIAAGVVVGAAFCVHEYCLKKTVPLVDIRVLVHNRIFVLSNMASLTIYASLFSLTFFFSLYLQYAKGMNSGEAGLVIFVQPLVQVVLTWVSGWLSDRIGPSPVALAGNFMAAASLGLAILLDAASPMWLIFATLALNGIGMALFVTPNTLMIMTSVDQAHLSQASGLVGTMRTGGMVMSMVIATLTLRLAMGSSALSVEVSPELVSAMHASFLIFAALCLLSFLCSVVRFQSFRKK